MELILDDKGIKVSFSGDKLTLSVPAMLKIDYDCSFKLLSSSTTDDLNSSQQNKNSNS